MLDVRPTDLVDVLEIRTERRGDERGWFTEVWNRAQWAEHGIAFEPVQDNHSRSEAVGVVRGLHYQVDPLAQDKLVRVTRGAIFDVAVDLRRSSRSYGHWVGVELSEDKGNQLLIPRGFAHGFMTLRPGTEVQYKVSAPYSPKHERGVRFDDPTIGIVWPQIDAIQLSLKDDQAPQFAEIEAFA